MNYHGVFVGVADLGVVPVAIGLLRNRDEGVGRLLHDEVDREELPPLRFDAVARVEVVLVQVVDVEVAILLAEVLDRHPEDAVFDIGLAEQFAQSVVPLVRLVAPGAAPPRGVMKSEIGCESLER